MAKKKQSTPIRRKKKKAEFRWSKGFWKNHLLQAAILFALPFLFYLRTLPYDYVLDDKIVFTENNYTKKGLDGIFNLLSTESMAGYFGEQKDLVMGARYRPLSLVTFAMEFAFFKKEGIDDKGEVILEANPYVSHFINILLYALTVLLLFRLMALLVPNTKNYWFLQFSFITALFFALHPVHVEVVANVKGRDEIMTVLGSLATLYFALRYVATKKNHWVFWAGLSYFLALLSKENAITLLGVLPLTLYFFTKAKRQRYLVLLGMLLGITLLYLLMRYQIIGYLLNTGKEITDLINNPFYGMSLDERLATIFYTLGLYLKLMLFPHPLTHDYYPYHIPIMNWGMAGSLISLLSYLGLGIIALWTIRSRSFWSYCILFFIMTLSIVSNIVFPVGTFMNERFIYFSSIAFCMAMGYLICITLPKLTKDSLNVFSLGIAVLFLSLYAFKTWTRVPVWESALTLNSAAIQVSKNSTRANCFYGTALFDLYLAETDPVQRKAYLDQVELYINKSLEIYPTYYSALQMKAGIAAERWKMDRDTTKLLEVFKQIIYLKGGLPFIDEFLDYLATRQSYNELADFAYEVGNDFFSVQQKNYPFAIKYLNYGLKVAPNDIRLQAARNRATQAYGQ